MNPSELAALPGIKTKFKTHLLQYFGTAVPREELMKLADYGVEFTLWYYPNGPIDSSQFLAAVKVCANLLILDDWLDVKESTTQGGQRKGGHASVMRLLLNQWQKLDDSEMSEELEEALQS